ncbi:hypothetical protein B4U80_02997 [Leptotrombidium deliense]|uniref:Alpha-latrotoxin n=1 Tax=Leptotrombidium deliense TaxID=299467 RepID=A0A443S8C5_9ACAR|nr:hypothetical protein B4U80_02997 [Leptotrombidium deliense]
MESKNALLLYVSKIGELSVVKRLIDEGVDINTKDKDGNSAIHLATEANHVEVLKFLLQNDADINVVNDDGNSALHVAILSLSLECVELLLEEQIKVNRFNNQKKSELMCAMQLDFVEPFKEKTEKIIELLINNGNIDLKTETVDSVIEFDGSNYLFYAIECRNFFAFQKLIEKDITLCDTKNKFQNYPIHEAVTQNQLNMTKLLISKSRKYIDIKGDKGFTPLHNAVNFVAFRTIEYLIEQNADVNQQTSYGLTPLFMATTSYRDCCMNAITVCKYTLSLKIATKFEEKVTLFRKKCAFLAIAAYLIENGGANIYLQDENGHTPLDVINKDEESITLKMLYMQKPLIDKINSLKNELHSVRIENNHLRVDLNRLEDLMALWS